MIIFISALKSLVMIIVVETAVPSSIRFCMSNVMDGLIQQICSQPARPTAPPSQQPDLCHC